MRILSKKSKTIIAAAAIIGLTGSGVAYSFWTIGGTGGGTATTGTVVGITVNQTSTVGNLFPGGTAQPLSGTFTNSNASAVTVTSVSAAVDTSNAALFGPGKCLAADFTIIGSSNNPGTILPGTGGSWTGLSIQMNQTLVNQDGCKLKAIPLLLTSN